jgi:hypothetical protein
MHAGVVDQHIKPAERGDRGCDRPIDIGHVGDIRLERQDTALWLRSEPGERVTIAVTSATCAGADERAAVARPIPFAAPVTSTDLPSKPDE